MSNKIFMLLLGATISFIASILTSIVNSIISSWKDAKKRKFDLIDKIYSERIAAYKAIYCQLTILKDEFQKHSIDFIETEDHTFFDPTEKIEKFRKVFFENIIFYSEQSTKIFKHAIFYMWNMSGFLPVNSEDGIDNHSIIEFARESMVYIDNCLEIIRQDMGLDEIEKIFK